MRRTGGRQLQPKTAIFFGVQCPEEADPAFCNGMGPWGNPYLLKTYGITCLTVHLAAFSQERSSVPHRLGSFLAFPGDQSPQGFQPSSFTSRCIHMKLKPRRNPTEPDTQYKRQHFYPTIYITYCLLQCPRIRLMAHVLLFWVSLRSNMKSGGCQRRFATGKQALL